MDSVSAAYWGCAAIAWGALGFKLGGLRRSPDHPIHRVICGTLFLVGASLFCAAPAVVTVVNRATGVANLAALLVYCLVVCEGAAALILVVHWRGPADPARAAARRWTLGYAGIIATMITLFVLGETPVERPVDFDTYYARTPYIAGFIVLYLVAHAVAGIGVGLLCWRWVRVAGRPWLRRGLWAILVGVGLGVGFDVCKLAAVAARWAGADLDALSTVVAPALAGLGTITIATGFVLPVVGERLSRPVGRAAAYRALHPLWEALRRSTPSIVTPIRLPWWDLELRLTRRLTEILDGRLALRPYFDPAVARAATRIGRESGLTGAELRAVVDAAMIRAAVANKAHDRRFPPEPDGTDPAGADPAGFEVDGAGELARLVRVARAYVSSPIVGAAGRRSSLTPARNEQVKRG
ncbi:hypothetical protein O7627_16340 [Solwaraspora sp. WMMD1047]|uniref:MAB_1171c family putative transporter n=1 Tax=Solwaraspora sp. WMMD1047 TaxID=3016102 RepID=UPI0024167C79|nr:MAB_1171c family putative transporter [Solwaraspora sp. WMMD1047]MDG4830867.1 hypothetical protein [Solwaraspora sp. WMMD1047]